MKKIVALVLALVMVLSIGTVAFAQPKWKPTTARIDAAKLAVGFGKAVTGLAKMGSKIIADRYDDAIKTETGADKESLANLAKKIKESTTPSQFYASMFDYRVLAPFYNKKIEESTKQAVVDETKEIAKDATWAAIWTHDKGVDIFGLFLGNSTKKAADKARKDLEEAAGKVDDLQFGVRKGFELFAKIFGKGNVQTKITMDSDRYIGKIEQAIASATSQVKTEITVSILEKVTAVMPASFTDLVETMILGNYPDLREPLQDDLEYKSVYEQALKNRNDAFEINEELAKTKYGYDSGKAYALFKQAEAWEKDHNEYLIGKALFDEVTVYYQKYLDELKAQSQKQDAVTEFGAAIKAPLQIVKAFNEILAEQAQKKTDKAIGSAGIGAWLFNKGAENVKGKLIDAAKFFDKYNDKNTADTIANVVSYLFRILPGNQPQ